MNSSLFLRFFIVFSFVYLLLPFIGMEEISWYMKPFLLIILIGAVFSSNGFSTKKHLLLGIFFSLLGDILLMFANKGELYFILGLVAFLIAHVLYIVLFRKQNFIQKKTYKPLLWLGTLAIGAYYFILINTLYSKLGSLQIPVIVYGLVITTMLISAFHGFLKWEKPASYFILLGALFFVTSDSLLAFNKFNAPINNSDFFIMATYSIAQFGIVYGILQLNKKP